MIGFPMSWKEWNELRARVDSGTPLTRGQSRELLDAYENLMTRMLQADMGLQGNTDRTYFGADTSTTIEKERTR